MPTLIRAHAFAAFMLSATFAGSSPAANDDLAPLRETVTALAQSSMEAEKIPGLSLALFDDRGIIWATGFGLADVGGGVPARAETVYSAGNLSMPVSAAAVMQRVEQGDIELDHPLAAQLPAFSIRTRFDKAPPITPRNLLSHHSGLPAKHFKGMWTRAPLSLADFVTVLREEYAAAPPQRVFSTSEPGYAVLGRLLEVRSKRDFAPYMQEHLLAPLGMTQSSFIPPGSGSTRAAKGYWRGKIEAPAFALRDVPAVGLYSNVLDLARFARMLLNGGELDGRRVLKPESVAEMLRPQNARVALDLDNRIGLGWRLSGVHIERATRIVWQVSATPVGRSRLLLAPDQKLGVVVLSNSSTGGRAIDQVSETLLELALQLRQPLPATRVPAPVATPALDTTADFSGRYASVLGMIAVEAVGDSAHAELLGKTVHLTREPDGLYSIQYRLLGLIPLPISVLREARVQPAVVDGRTSLIVHYKDQVHRFAEKVPDAPVPPAWHKRQGYYEVVDVDPLIELVELKPLALEIDDGVLLFSYPLPGWMGLRATVPVVAVSDTELVLAGTGWLMGETVKVVKKDGEERLRYSGFELRRLDD